MQSTKAFLPKDSYIDTQRAFELNNTNILYKNIIEVI